MIDALRSEWVKLRSVTSTVVLYLTVAGVSVGIGLLATAAVPLDDESVVPADRLTFALAGVSTALTFLSVIGVLLITQEFRFETVRVTFAAEPSRARVILAKAGVLAAAAAVVSAVMVALATLIGAAVLSARGAPIDFSLPGTSRVLVGAVVLAVLYSLAGLGIGTILKSQPLAIVVVVVWPLLVEGIFGGIFPSLGKWLPFLAAGQLLSVEPKGDKLDPWLGAAYLAAVVVGLIVAGIVLVRRRDA